MKPQELRIGNLIYDDEGLISKVIGFTPFDYSTTDDELEGCIILADIYDANGKQMFNEFQFSSYGCKPIKLKAEWLLKFGFEKKEIYLLGKTCYGWLRIGNYVLAVWEDDNENEHENICRITGLSENYDICEVWDLSLDNLEKEKIEYHEMVGPIKITEELLIELGFTKDEDEFIYGLLSLENRATDKYSKNIDPLDFGVWFDETYIREIRYVHDLQNLYHSIYSKELEFKNK